MKKVFFNQGKFLGVLYRGSDKGLKQGLNSLVNVDIFHVLANVLATDNY